MDRVIVAGEPRERIEIFLGEGALDDANIIFHAPCPFPSRCFCTLPAAVRGKSGTATKRLGTL